MSGLRFTHRIKCPRRLAASKVHMEYRVLTICVMPRDLTVRSAAAALKNLKHFGANGMLLTPACIWEFNLNMVLWP